MLVLWQYGIMAKKVNLKDALQTAGTSTTNTNNLPPSVYNRKNRKAITVYLELEVARALKRFAVDENTTIQKTLETEITAFLKKAKRI